MRRICTTILFLGVVLSARTQPSGETVSPAWDFPEARQFDFWLGEWSVNNRFLRSDGRWSDGGKSVAKIYLILDGKAVLEFWDGKLDSGNELRGFSLRYYDRASGSWRLALNWPAPNAPGFSELQGWFRHGRGEFFSENQTEEGKTLLTRYSFSDISHEKFRWDNGRSSDNGRSWTGTWIMEFSRTQENATFGGPDVSFHTYEEGERCRGEHFGGFDGITGDWEGTISRRVENGWKKSVSRLRARRVLDGCAVFSLAEHEGEDSVFKEFRLHSYIPQYSQWTVLVLDNESDSGFRYEGGSIDSLPARLTDRKRFQRTRWLNIAENSLQFEMIRSEDAGVTWEVTSKVDLSRK